MTEDALQRFRLWRLKHVPAWPEKSAFHVWAATEKLTNEERRKVWEQIQPTE